MVHYKSLFVALAAVSTVAAGPCKAITSSVQSTTAAVSEVATSTTVSETSVAETTATSAAESTSTNVQDPTTTSASETDATIIDETIITTAPTTTIDIVPTTTTAEATTSAAAPADNVCGITGFFVTDHEMTFLLSPGIKNSAKECLEGCAAFDGCEVIAFYDSFESPGRCEYFSGELITDGMVTWYKWYDVGCLAEM
ncbi:uncharacterized protein FIESC28_05714 [Fusarium coffeatum]|uniref:Apple domain-containing protein n=1 Tax=Fusarium coffeatum TaxID=231269 RepID=A0A366RQ74_9HYPO|nr:uncharacterized protein FIESC28_05714 [Fusarium coffeatum]RBR19249.1 hypothetical protein FIESC28_05714 [Fusarium coffeatum]